MTNKEALRFHKDKIIWHVKEMVRAKELMWSAGRELERILGELDIPPEDIEDMVGSEATDEEILNVVDTWLDDPDGEVEGSYDKE